MDKPLSFRQRIERLENAARCLDEVATIIADEVESMAAAEKRFATRRTTHKASR